MTEIRLVASEREQQQFMKLAQYCFNDEVGWTDFIFPLSEGDAVWGIFEGDQLLSGAISKAYGCNLFDEILPAAGISCVVTGPQNRNRGLVRQIMTRVIELDHDAGKVASLLYPFRFGFYEKFGYGWLGPAAMHEFDPNDVLVTEPPAGRFTWCTGSDEEMDGIQGVLAAWAKNYDLGLIPPRYPTERHAEALNRLKRRELLYYDATGECRGFAQLMLKSEKPFQTDLHLRRAAWDGPEAFRALLHFVWAHRNQCKKVLWWTARAVPVHLAVRELRLTRKDVFMWMGRPLNVKKVLERKYRREPFDGRIVLSVEDPVLTQNTGTYTIEGDAVSRRELTGENLLPFDLFSSLVFGSFGVEEAALAGLVPREWAQEAAQAFPANPTLYITEFF
jgi:predicted acetyltransferase